MGRPDVVVALPIAVVIGSEIVSDPVEVAVAVDEAAEVVHLPANESKRPHDEVAVAVDEAEAVPEPVADEVIEADSVPEAVAVAEPVAVAEAVPDVALPVAVAVAEAVELSVHAPIPRRPQVKAVEEEAGAELVSAGADVVVATPVPVAVADEPALDVSAAEVAEAVALDVHGPIPSRPQVLAGAVEEAAAEVVSAGAVLVGAELSVLAPSVLVGAVLSVADDAVLVGHGSSPSRPQPVDWDVAEVAEAVALEAASVLDVPSVLVGAALVAASVVELVGHASKPSRPQPVDWEVVVAAAALVVAESVEPGSVVVGSAGGFVLVGASLVVVVDVHASSPSKPHPNEVVAEVLVVVVLVEVVVVESVVVEVVESVVRDESVAVVVAESVAVVVVLAVDVGFHVCVVSVRVRVNNHPLKSLGSISPPPSPRPN